MVLVDDDLEYEFDFDVEDDIVGGGKKEMIVG